LSFPIPRKRVALLLPDADEVDVELEMLEVCDAEDDAAEGGRSMESDLERSRAAGDCRKRGSLEAGVVGDVGDSGRADDLSVPDVDAGTIGASEAPAALWRPEGRLAVPEDGRAEPDAGMLVIRVSLTL
jgi:hypothetical protein